RAAWIDPRSRTRRAPARRIIPPHRTFPLDSRNENLPEKRIHQSCAEQPGRATLPGFFVAHRARRRMRRSERNLRVQEQGAGAASLFWGCSLQEVLQLERVGRSMPALRRHARLVFCRDEAMNGRDNEAAVPSERKEEP